MNPLELTCQREGFSSFYWWQDNKSCCYGIFYCTGYESLIWC